MITAHRAARPRRPFSFFQQFVKGPSSLESHRDSVLGDAIGLKSYFTDAEIWHLHLGMFLIHKQGSVDTGRMSSVEIGQMSASETGQMSAAETKQMGSVKTGRRQLQ